MYKHLSQKQRQILNYNFGKAVVKACPGSGKTYSVAARLSRLITEHSYKRKGIAAISFTNVACEEINDKLFKDFNIITPLGYPHFLGTLDSFINKYIFLPFGHLLMNCKSRPELVGEPHLPWSIKKFEFDYDQYFDKTSFDIKGNLVRIVDPRSFKFIWKEFNKDGSIDGNLRRINDSKMRLFKLGYANQSDANYFAFKLLKKYPLIANNIANKFEYIIIDEAQDTDDFQMSILEILISNGAENVMLIGDRDQAIFEWNNAKPELFDNKYDSWDKIDLDENRRSSQNICDFIKHLSTFKEVISINSEVKDFKLKPEISGFKWYKKKRGTDEWIVSVDDSIGSFKPILDNFLNTCTTEGIDINRDNVAVLYRGRNNSKFLGLSSDIYTYERTPWLDNDNYVKDIVRGKHLFDNQDLKSGYRLLEKGFFEAMNKLRDKNFYCSAKFIKNEIEVGGLKKHRNEVFNFIDILPNTSERTLYDWIEESNKNLATNGYEFTLAVVFENSKILIDELFGNDLNTKYLLPYYYGTIHSVKGRTFEAVLVLLGKTAGSSKNYSTILNTDSDSLDKKYKEELRIVYVGISRPRKILILATPDDDVDIWKEKFNLE